MTEAIKEIKNQKLHNLRMQVFNPKKPFQTIVPIVLCAAIVAGIILLATSLSVFSVSEPIYRFDTGAKLEYTGRTTFEQDEDSGVIMLKNHGEKAELDHAPVYFTDDADRILLPAQMIIAWPEVRKNGRSSNNMLIEKTGDKLTAKVRSKDVDVSDAFLYDGDNTYVFLKPVKITIGLEEIELPAYSYAYVYYGLRMELYSPDGSINVVTQTGDEIITATAPDLSYEIDLSRDVLRTDEGEVLLITDPSLLNYVTDETGKK
jgi:hypothetical protein